MKLDEISPGHVLSMVLLGFEMLMIAQDLVGDKDEL